MEESGTNMCEINFQEPQVTSLNTEERKLARRLRIERRIKNLRKQVVFEDGTGPAMEEERVAKTLLQQQLEKSEETLEKLILEGYNNATNIRVVSDGREIDRRDLEGIDREKIFNCLEEESALAQTMFDEIASKWLQTLKSNEPLYIYDEMESQKQKCNELINQKDALIATLKEEVRQAERKFSNDQKKQINDIQILTELLEQQVKKMRKAYRDELMIIEEMVVVERQMLCEMNDKKWEELYNRRENEERKQVEKEFEQREEFMDKMKKLRQTFQEKYRALKISLQGEYTTLVKDVEKLKGLVILNTEKVDYNFQILKKREDENIIIKSQQKRRMNKLQDVINDLRNKVSEYDEKTKSEIARLKIEVKNMQKCVIEIENKATSLSKINDLKHKQVWDLNIENANKLLHRILTIDRRLHEQQMGLEWKKPETVLLTKMDLSSYKEGVAMLQNEKEIPRLSLNNMESSVGKALAISNVQLKGNVGYNALLQQILQQVADNAGFLIEEKLLEIIKPYREEEQSLIKIDSVFMALGIKNSDDVDLMFKYFFAYARCAICTKSSISIKVSNISVLDNILEEENQITSTDSCTSIFPLLMTAVNESEGVIEEVLKSHELPTHEEHESASLPSLSEKSMGSLATRITKLSKVHMSFIDQLEKQSFGNKLMCKLGHPLVVNSIYVIKALREFITDFYAECSEAGQVETNLTKKCQTISRLLTHDDMKLFWDKYTEVFCGSKERLWDGLLEGLKKYYQILRDRKKVCDEVICLREKNRKFKMILTQYEIGRAIKPPCAEQREMPVKTGIVYCRKLS